MRWLLAASIAVSGAVPGSYRVGHCQLCSASSGDQCCGCCQRLAGGQQGARKCCARSVGEVTEVELPPCCRRVVKTATTQATSDRGVRSRQRVTVARWDAELSRDRCSCSSAPAPLDPMPVPDSESTFRGALSPAQVDHSAVETILSGCESVRLSRSRLHDTASLSGRARLVWLCVWRP